MRIITFLPLLAAVAMAVPSGSQLTLSDIRANARVVDAETSPAIISVNPTVVTAEPVSSLSFDEAMKLAEGVAAHIQNGFVIRIGNGYTGELSPAVPANSILVAERIPCTDAKVGDLVLLENDGRYQIRRLLQRLVEQAIVVGYEHGKERAGVKETQIKGRVVVTILFDPKTPSSGRVQGPMLSH